MNEKLKTAIFNAVAEEPFAKKMGVRLVDLRIRPLPEKRGRCAVQRP